MARCFTDQDFSFFPHLATSSPFDIVKELVNCPLEHCLILLIVDSLDFFNHRIPQMEKIKQDNEIIQN